MNAALPALVGVATLVAVIGAPAAVAAPVAMAALAWAIWRAPLRTCVLVLLFLCLIADVPQDNPMNGEWQSPLYFLGLVLCTNWSKAFGISGLPFSGLDVACAALAARVLARGRTRGAGILGGSLAAFAAAIVALFAVGAVRSGSAGAAYWQVRQLACVPVLAWLLMQVIENEGDFMLAGRLVLGAALVKAADGLWFYFAIVRPQGLRVPVIVSHAETMLFCLAVALLAIRWMEQPDRRALRRGLLFGGVLLAAIWLNDRRIAWAGLAGSLLVIWRMSRWNAAKRSAARVALISAPLLAAYVAAGWMSADPLFKPVRAIRTMVAPKENAAATDASSTQWRRIENFNLSRTLRAHPLGIGLGHEYEQFARGADISEHFALYRYVPHNSVLWMMTAGGPIGFFLLWMPLAVGIFFCARAHRLAQTPVQRMAALASICAVVLFIVQAYGDMGTQTWSTTWLLAAALAVAGRLAAVTGGAPAPRLEVAWAP